MTRKELADKIKAASLIRGRFSLRSGAVSDEYFDKYRFESDPDLLLEICNGLSAILPSSFDHLAGLELGGIPIATVLSQITKRTTLFVRKSRKEYGTCRINVNVNKNGVQKDGLLGPNTTN
jgi:orotate phosphoribosyltransferase